MVDAGVELILTTGKKFLGGQLFYFPLTDDLLLLTGALLGLTDSRLPFLSEEVQLVLHALDADISILNALVQLAQERPALCPVPLPRILAVEHDRAAEGELLAEPVARLRQSAERMDIAPREHARIAGEAQHLIARFSGNKPLLRTIEELTSRALWRMAWRDTPLDFTTRARRQASAKYWGDLVRAIKAGDAARAEHVARRLQEASRDHMIAAMAAHRAMSVAAD